MIKSLPVLLMALVLLCLPLGETMRCCMNFASKPLPLNRLKDFTIQDATTVCRLHAVIFTTVTGRKICASPDSTWVKNALNYMRPSRKSKPKRG
ncbi:C-C motif chemokine 20 [Neoarius graeffei]|uniref:C-C motif chemokine 20 n=1 Tax=Neoarius graeffei TaxID=443677 RepID=UPI00298C8859|nr:C-C motif chemokine 20 [Neoarius graeffei]